MNEDISDFNYCLLEVFIDEASRWFLSKNIKKWRIYVVFAGSPFWARPLAVVKISQVPLDQFCSNLQRFLLYSINFKFGKYVFEHEIFRRLE